MAATETLLQGATQVTSSLSANYTAGGGTLSMAAALNDHGGTPVAGPFEILVGRNRPLAERRYFVATPSGSNLTVTPSPGYTDNQNFVIGDLIDVISAWETQRRLRAFATLHTHTGAVDGTTLVDAGIASNANITLTKLDDGPADDTVSIASTPTTLQGTINRIAAVIKRITGEAAYTTLPASTIGALFAKFHASTGHKHTGGTDDAPQLGVGAFVATPEASVTKTAVQSISNGAWNILAFDSERLDNDTIHDNVTNNSRLICKTAGRYLVWGVVSIAANGTGGRGLGLFKNSGGTGGAGTPLHRDIRQSVVVVTGFETSMAVGRIVPLVVNDYLELHAFQDSGGALNTVQSAEYSPEFGMRWLGP